MKRSIIQEKSFAFAVRIVGAARSLQNGCKDFVLSNQLLRSGTSIGANVEEALGAQSQKDFIAKLSIAAKETRETGYWLRLVTESGLSSDPQLEELFKECEELLKVLNSIILTTRQRSTQNS